MFYDTETVKLAIDKQIGNKNCQFNDHTKVTSKYIDVVCVSQQLFSGIGIMLINSFPIW